MRELEMLSFEDVVERLTNPADTVILFHRNPDADAVGSAFALREILEGLGSRAWCVCESELPERLQFLTGGVQDSVLPASVPADFTDVRVISVDSAAPSQLGELWELYGDRVDMMLDHHESGQPYADHYIREGDAATGEIIFDLAKRYAVNGLIDITDSLCVALYAAISSDTGGFRFSNVSAHTHLRASELMLRGIDCAEINHRLFDTFSLEQLRARAAGISNLHLFADGKIAVITFPYALKIAIGLEDDHLDTLVDVARSLKGVCVAASIRQPATEGTFRVSVRSSCDYDVSELCAGFGGGGHTRAAGCTIYAADTDEAMQKLVAAIDATALG